MTHNLIKADKQFNYYYEHSLSEEYHKSRFYFDGGYSIDESKRPYEELDGEFYIYPKFQNTTYTKVIPNGYWPNQRKKSDKFFIALRQANQEYNLLDSSHKIVWSYANPSKFYFTSVPIIWARNQFNAIGSENKDELLYLFALLNSSVNFKILRENVKSDNEKDILFSITAIKSFIKTPVISKENQQIKNEIINSAIALIDLEQDTLISLIDFKGIMLQKFETAEVVGNNLHLHYKDKEAKCKINGNVDLVKNIVSDLKKFDLLNEDGIGNVSNLKSLSAFDKVYQTKLKNYIDDLVFALYFKIKLPDLGFENAAKIKDTCEKHKYYKLVNSK